MYSWIAALQSSTRVEVSLVSLLLLDCALDVLPDDSPPLCGLGESVLLGCCGRRSRRFATLLAKRSCSAELSSMSPSQCFISPNKRCTDTSTLRQSLSNSGASSSKCFRHCSPDMSFHPEGISSELLQQMTRCRSSATRRDRLRQRAGRRLRAWSSWRCGQRRARPPMVVGGRQGTSMTANPVSPPRCRGGALRPFVSSASPLLLDPRSWTS